MELSTKVFLTLFIVLLCSLVFSFGTVCQNGYLFKNNVAVLFFNNKISCK